MTIFVVYLCVFLSALRATLASDILFCFQTQRTPAKKEESKARRMDWKGLPQTPVMDD